MPKLIRPRSLPEQTVDLTEVSHDILRQVDEILQDPVARMDRSYGSIRNLLNKVPRAQRGLDWTERVIALYCAKQMKERRCSVLKLKIMRARKAADQEQAWQDFNARLRPIIAPKVLTNHGLMLPFAARDQQQIADELTSLFALLHSLGYTAFINSGTLLGAVREGHFLGHDDDADFAVLLGGETDDAVITALHNLCDRLNATGALRKPAWYHKKGPIIKVLLDSDIEVDLFPLWVRNDRAYIWPHTHGDLSKDDIFPLSTQNLCGADMPAPRLPEKMLTLNYGEGWRHPDPNFFFPWDVAKERFATIIEKYQKQHNKATWIALLKKFIRRRDA